MRNTNSCQATDTYTELRTLGEGASGKVVLARHEPSGELVAIKRLSPRLVRDQGFVARFREEADILRRLRHPNIAGPHWHAELAGTPRYMAPEQWKSAQASPQTDVYAAAAVSFECLVGERPFTGTSLNELRSQHLSGGVPLEKLPEGLRQLIGTGMAKDPAERF